MNADGALAPLQFCKNWEGFIWKHIQNYLLINVWQHQLPVDKCLTASTPTLTAQKMMFSIKDFFSKCDQIRRKLQFFGALTVKLLPFGLCFFAKKRFSYVLVFKKFRRKSRVVKFQYIPNAYTKYPTMKVYFQKLQSKRVSIEFILTIYASPPPPPKNKDKSNWKNHKPERRRIRVVEGWVIFPKGIFYLEPGHWILGQILHE